MAAKSGRKPRNEQQLEAIRTNIINHALQLFQSEGYDAVSIRRLAKEVGCAPMTIYAHFDGKINILQHLWAVVLNQAFTEIRSQVESGKDAPDRLHIAAQTFVNYWLKNPDHFRMVFISSGISRPDVGSFLKNNDTLSHFKYFSGLVMMALAADQPPSANQVKSKTDGLISALIGIVFCANTIADYPWTKPEQMVELMVNALIVE